ncbi:MAG: tetratricopeptide repeat protein [Pseudomonadota bacterium]
MKRTFCFGCGAEMAASPGELAPLCPRCRAKVKKQDGEQLWMVRHKGQRPQGPHKREVIEEWILRNLVQGSDEVACQDGTWAPFGTHEDFRAWFTPGHELNKRRTASLKARRRERSSRAWGARFRAVMALAGMAGVGVMVWLAIKTHSTVIPEPWIHLAKGTFDDLSSSFLDAWSSATQNPEERIQPLATALLPGEDVLAEIASTLPPSTEPARLHLLRGRDRLMKEIALAPEGAIRELEAAAVAAPRDVVSLAALAEIYGLAGKYQASKADQAIALLSRANALDPDVPDVLRARVVIAMGSGSYDNARKVAEECLVMDPENLHCRYYKGIALLALERWSEAAAELSRVHEAAPHVPRFRLALCEAAVQSGGYLRARAMIDLFVSEYPHVAEGYALSARLAWLTADYSRALKEAQKAVRLEPSDLESRLLAAELLLASGDPRGATGLLAPVLEEQSTRSHKLGARIFLVACYAQEALGDHDSARKHASMAHDLKPNWAPASFGLGTSFAMVGDLTQAEQIFKAAATDDLLPVEAGHFWVKLGRLYHEQGRAKAAMTAYERALEVYTASEDARLGLVAVYLDLSNLSKAVDMLRTIGTTDFEQDLTHPPNSIVPLEGINLRPLDAELSKAISEDIRFTRQRASIAGILAFHEGRLDEAQSLLLKALAEDDTDDIARGYLARILIHRRDWVHAEQILTRMLATPGNEGIYSAMLGICRARIGRGDTALSEMERTSQLIADVPAVHRLYAEALFRAGRKEKAAEEARNAYTLDPLDHQARRLILTEAAGDH